MTELRALTPDAPQVKRKRSDRVADAIRLWISDRQVAPGDRLPHEAELMRLFNVSKGTMREALKALEVQGLVRIKTGPRGGATVAQVPVDKAMELLGNYFYARDVSLRDIYAVRKDIEPRLARAVCGHLTDADLDLLEQQIGFCSCEPLATPVGHAQRISELDFHDVLADACPNELLAFFCRFVNSLLKNLAVCNQIYARPQRELGERARMYHGELVAAFRAGDADRAQELMHAHMVEAERLMLEREATVEPHFLAADEAPAADTA